MPKRLLFICLFGMLTIAPSFSQTPTWSDDIAAIFYENCTSCHHSGGIAPFSLMTYGEVLDYGDLIHDVVEHKEMPPWPADPDYRHFKDEKVLSDDELQAVIDWVHFDFPPGDLSEAPTPPTYGQGGSLLDTIDYVVAIEPYELQYNIDEYRWFVIPTNFTDTVYISHIEVDPGLETVVHHADISYDLSGASLANDLADPLPGFNSNTGGPSINYYINAWQPGGNVATYPENWGIAVPPGADFVVEIHYGPGGIGSIDSTVMHLQFIKEPENVRPVQVGWLLSDSAPVLLDGPLVIPANEVVSFHQRTNPLPQDLSLISICPHMHFLGKSYKVWAIEPGGDTIPLIDIPHWDFHWQRYYEFPQILKLPAGTIIESEGYYDNTLNNHDNPNNPPVTVFRGTRTIDEMFLCYFIFAPYHDGDENIVLDSTFIVDVDPVIREEIPLEIFPNPATDHVLISGELPHPESINFKIINLLGQEMRSWGQDFQSATISEQINTSAFRSGVYFIEWKSKSFKGVLSFIKKE